LTHLFKGTKMKKLLLKTIFLFLAPPLFAIPVSKALEISVEVTIPKISTQPYHKPYVAIWLETKNRRGIYTLAFWHEQKDWFKDLRQWWRKIGRQGQPNYDQVTGATKKPGTYTVRYDGKNIQGQQLPAGEYYLNVEAVREDGGREFIRQKIFLGEKDIQRYQKSGKHELATVVIEVTP